MDASLPSFLPLHPLHAQYLYTPGPPGLVDDLVPLRRFPMPSPPYLTPLLVSVPSPSASTPTSVAPSAFPLADAAGGPSGAFIPSLGDAVALRAPPPRPPPLVTMGPRSWTHAPLRELTRGLLAVLLNTWSLSPPLTQPGDPSMSALNTTGSLQGLGGVTGGAAGSSAASAAGAAGAAATAAGATAEGNGAADASAGEKAGVAAGAGASKGAATTARPVTVMQSPTEGV